MRKTRIALFLITIGILLTVFAGFARAGSPLAQDFTNQPRFSNDISRLGVLLQPGLITAPASSSTAHAYAQINQAVDGHWPQRCNDCHIFQYMCAMCHQDIRPPDHYSGDCHLCHSPWAWLNTHVDHALPEFSDCQACHLSIRPKDHYEARCSTCHAPGNGWLQINFSHDQLPQPVQCASCHLSLKPANHFTGDCSTCHTPAAWSQVSVDHKAAGFTDCISCHLAKRPKNHFTGQCSTCHSTQFWKPARFNHQNATDCQACHLKDRPANHYEGQCSKCHSPGNWRNVQFNHKGFTDCQSCHSNDRPTNHYSGQCSQCHNTSTWKGAKFDHGGLKDCQSCHTPPANHWEGQCSKCHSPGSWNPQTGGHGFPMDHGGAGGNCETCHVGKKLSVNCYTCHNKAETESKHAEEGILDIAGRCLECHPNGTKPDD